MEDHRSCARRPGGRLPLRRGRGRGNGHDALFDVGSSGPSLNSSSFESSAANPHCCGSKKPHSSWIGPDFLGFRSADGAAGLVTGRAAGAGRAEAADAAAPVPG